MAELPPGFTGAQPAPANLTTALLAALVEVISTLPREGVEALAELLVSRLDRDDGDPDLEEPGLEDGFVEHEPNGPGCPLADPGGDGDPSGEVGDRSYAEWNTLPAARRRAGHVDGKPVDGLSRSTVEEDDEHDDQDQCLAHEDIGTAHRAKAKMGFPGDCASLDPEQDLGAGEDEAGAHIEVYAIRPTYDVDQTKGPTNEHAAGRTHRAQELGLVPNGRGGWRVPS